MSIVDFLHKYLGKPYSTCDCWDLAKLFYREVLDIDMSMGLEYENSVMNTAFRKKILEIVNLHKSKFITVTEVEVGDLILFNILGISSHIGVYIGNKKFVHSIKETGCVVESLVSWNKKVEGYYRWPN